LGTSVVIVKNSCETQVQDTSWGGGEVRKERAWHGESKTLDFSPKGRSMLLAINRTRKENVDENWGGRSAQLLLDLEEDLPRGGIQKTSGLQPYWEKSGGGGGFGEIL